jgi:Domain of unknown function (DUF6935)
MKTRIIVLAAACLSMASVAYAGQSIAIPGTLPSGTACEKAWIDAKTPEAAAVVFIAALITYQFDEDVARDCMTRIVDKNYLSNGTLSRDFEYLIDVGIKRNAEIARSYVSGAVPENGYALPGKPWTIRFTRDKRYDLGDHLFRVKVYTSGQPTTRPITMRKDENGHYRINETSTLFVGVAAPR